MLILGTRKILALTLLGVLVALGAASAVELLDAELVAAGSPVLQSASGTVRLEQGRLDAVGRRVFVAPEPGMLWQLGSGIGFLAFLARRRSRHAEKENAVTKKRFRLRAPWFAILLMCVAVPGLAQVPQDMTYTGRLVNERGKPLSGPVDLELRIFDVETGGTQLYSEQHLNEPLDADGGFSVQLGLGTNPSGPFDANLFSDMNRWLEVVVDGEILAPRQIIGSVPWALVAERVAGSGSDAQVLHVFDWDGIAVGRYAGGGVVGFQVFDEANGLIFGIDRDGTLNVPNETIFFTSTNCSGTPYFERGALLMAGFVYGQHGNRLFTLEKSAPWLNALVASSMAADVCIPREPQYRDVRPGWEVLLDFDFPLPTPLYVDLAPEPAP